MIRAANTSPGQLPHYARRDSVPDTMEEAIEILIKYRNNVQHEEWVAEKHREEERISAAFRAGVEAEAKRAKEARRGRKH